MPIEITLPRQGWSMEKAAFVEWLKKDGETVSPGDPLFAVETDKAVQDIESLDAGILHIPPNGPQKDDIIHVGDVIGYLAEAGETVSFDKITGNWTADADTDNDEAQTASAPAVPEEPEKVSLSPAAPVTPPCREFPAVSPRAAGKALRAGIDLRTVTGSGADGRIREQDITAAPRSAASAPVTDRELPVSGLRRTIAERMVKSLNATAPVTLTATADVSKLVSLREQFKLSATPDEPAPAYHDFVIKLTAMTLAAYPMLNARWEESRIVMAGAINIGLAVDTEDGLLVPVVRNAASLTLRQLAISTRDLVDRARRRQLTPDELSGGTFTVSNLGALGIDAFTPIINHPECAILGLGRICREPAVADGQIVIRERMWLSLTFDHRIVDGAPAARFFDALRRRIENPVPGLTGW
ncbi:MAG: dihydrolipoamide acetyltransferase family protein [Victivallaceae bacterium]|nr:dihydrolipoamide acetyltransferase family protein [Victivallaceae bacterium]